MTLKRKLKKAIEQNDDAQVQRIEKRLAQRNQRWQVAKLWLRKAATAAISFSALGMNPDRINYEIKNLKSGNMFNKSWKTTSAGILAIATGVTRMVFAVKAHAITEETIMTSLTAIMSGIGLLFARDNNVTSEQAGCK